jgi:hypothetical protein
LIAVRFRVGAALEREWWALLPQKLESGEANVFVLCAKSEKGIESNKHAHKC